VLSWLLRDRSGPRPPVPLRQAIATSNHEDLYAIVGRLRTQLAEAEGLQRQPQPQPVSAADASARAEIAGDYVRFVEQTLHHATRTVLQLTNQPVAGLRLAAMTEVLCRCLLADDVDASRLTGMLSSQTAARDHAVLHGVLVRLCDQASALRSRVQAETHSHHWSFAATLGLDMDPERQQPWRRSDPHLPVAGIVAPGLTMDGRLVCKQWVTTGQPTRQLGGERDAAARPPSTPGLPCQAGPQPPRRSDHQPTDDHRG
jgi:hypothetical protein